MNLIIFVMQVEGKIGPALLFEDPEDFIQGDIHNLVCLDDLVNCHHGLLISTWIRFTALRSGAHYIDTGRHGLHIFYTDQGLLVTAQARSQQWQVNMMCLYYQIFFETI
jgi:hypothetical protein